MAIPQAKPFAELLAKYEPEMAQAFLESIEAVGENADLKAMRAALENGNIEAAIQAMDLDTADFYRLEEKFREVFITAGVELSDGAPVKDDPFSGLVRLRFVPRHPIAEAFLRDHSAGLVRDIVADTREALRSTMAKALADGKNPTTIVNETVGRINRATGRRDGGVLGLTSAQASYVDNAADELASGDPAAWSSYRERKQRNAHYDAAIREALQAGKPVPASTMKAALDSYRNRLLAQRAKVIGRTETMSALNQGRVTAIEQAIAEGKVLPENVRKVWRSAHDGRVRSTHAILDGKSAAWGEAFTSSSGARLMFPTDRSLGAPASEIIQCRCSLQIKIDYFSGVV